MSGPSGTVPPMTDQDHALLELEGRQWRHVGAKEEAIRAETGLTPTAAYARLAQLLEDPAAEAAHPTLVRRLRRLRDARRAVRSPARLPGV